MIFAVDKTVAVAAALKRSLFSFFQLFEGSVSMLIYYIFLLVFIGFYFKIQPDE